MRVLAIDIGSNSTLHLIADVDSECIRIVATGIVANRLGAELDKAGRIPEAVMLHNQGILTKILIEGEKHGVERRGAVGTQVLRVAANRNAFLAMAADVGIEIEILSSEQEALLGWQGAFGSSGPDRTTALLDVGGGSTELTLGDREGIVWSGSLPIGAVQIALEFFEDDPPTVAQIAMATIAIDMTLSVWQERIPPNTPLNGIAGTITALTSIEKRLLTYTPGMLESAILTRITITDWTERLLEMNESSRNSLPGMPPARAHAIHSGALLLDRVMNLFSFSELTVSERGILYGLALSLVS